MASVTPAVAHTSIVPAEKVLPSRKSLAQPLQLGPYTMRNRVVMASLTRNRSEGTYPNHENAVYYAQRSSAGLIVSEGTLIVPHGTEWPNAPVISTPRHAQAWRQVTDAVHKNGSLIFCQLWHVGRTTHPLHQCGMPVVGPSAVPAKGGKFRLLNGKPGYQVPEAIENPLEYVEMYRHAAKMAMEAGFDGVELHSANGYLPNQFLDMGSNKRTDEWGGDYKNRCRFTLACIDALIAVWGPGRVGVKLSPGGGVNDVGQPEDELHRQYSYLLEEFSKRGIAYVQIARYWKAADPAGRGHWYDYKKLVKHFTGGRILLNAEYDPDSAAKEIESGVADAIVFGHDYISNPDLAERALLGVPFAPSNMNTWYSYEPGKSSIGYTNYPRAAL